MQDNIDIVRDFLAAWSRLDADELAGYFAEDGVYHNMPADPVSGRQSIRDFIQGFIGSWSSTNWEVLNLVAQGDLVIAERVDRTRLGERRVDLPCVGVFEMRDGRIRVWRDYFDMQTYVSAVS